MGRASLRDDSDLTKEEIRLLIERVTRRQFEHANVDLADISEATDCPVEELEEMLSDIRRSAKARLVSPPEDNDLRAKLSDGWTFHETVQGRTFMIGDAEHFPEHQRMTSVVLGVACAVSLVVVAPFLLSLLQGVLRIFAH